MKYIKPKKLGDYPLYIFIYWVILWGLAIILSLIGINISKEGDLVRKLDTSYYYVPLSEELKRMVIKTGIIVGVVTLLFGYSWMLYKWTHPRKKKRG